MNIIDELSQLIFPTRCYGCDRLGISICTECRREWIPHYYRTHIDELKVHSALLYTTTASKIILAAKENSIKGADELLVEAIIHVLNKAKARFSNLSIGSNPIKQVRSKTTWQKFYRRYHSAGFEKI